MKSFEQKVLTKFFIGRVIIVISQIHAPIQTQSRSRDDQEALNSAGFLRGLATVTEVTTTNDHAATATTGALSS